MIVGNLLMEIEITSIVGNIQVMKNSDLMGRKEEKRKKENKKEKKKEKEKEREKELIKKTENDGDWWQMCVLSLQPASDKHSPQC